VHAFGRSIGRNSYCKVIEIFKIWNESFVYLEETHLTLVENEETYLEIKGIEDNLEVIA
jgi:hypothetical protein